MKTIENWIWLPKSKYPNNQTTVFSGFSPNKSQCGNYIVAEFKKEYRFRKKVQFVDLCFSADTAFRLYLNDNFVATGPASAGGDWMNNDTSRDEYYSFEKHVRVDDFSVRFFARVQMMPVQICEYSKGHGGFMLFGIVNFADGSTELVCTDDSWLSRANRAYNAPYFFDGRISADDWHFAEVTPNIWHAKTANIPTRSEVSLPQVVSLKLAPRQKAEQIVEFDKIFAGFVCIEVQTEGEICVEAVCREIDVDDVSEKAVFVQNGEYIGFSLHSAGNIVVRAQNFGECTAQVFVKFVSTCYPVEEVAQTITSDCDLNSVLQVCAHTLQYCRQTHHLDSPRHCEPLACVGDYYIESLMTPFSFGDMKLAEFDLQCLANEILRNNGRIFHTSYSLIWVLMLRDVFMFTANYNLLKGCEKALIALLARFKTYIGKNGLVETPPDFMFVDWVYVDGFSLHHPPKALGQSVLNMFYFGALNAAEQIFGYLGNSAYANICNNDKSKLQNAINSLLFDSQKGMYFEGLNTPTDEKLLGEWMPQNTQKRYYLKHSNILAAYFGICDESCAQKLLKAVVANKIDGDIQPYFLYYLLEAIFRCNLSEQLTLSVLDRWKDSVKQCPKGLAEGFVAPSDEYQFDHSHAWGGTPLYSLPKALLGLKILQPGMKEICISPSLLGLQYANVELLTPFGKITCNQKQGQKPQITHPQEIKIVFD